MDATGIDFYPEDYCGATHMMASDWLCEDGLPVTDFHWWGSWEIEPDPDFTVVLYIFDDEGDKPKFGPPIWEYPVVVLDPGFTQGYYGTDGAGNDVYWYQIDLPEDDWFYQEIGKNYWFAITSPTAPGERYGWGWHNTADEQKYDSVYFGADYAWYYLEYPAGHEWAGLSADLAFEVTTLFVEYETASLSDGESVVIPGVVNATLEGVSATVTVAQYAENPGTGFAGDIGKYIDVHIEDAVGVNKIVIKLYYTEPLPGGITESDLVLWWWDGTSWSICSETGVNTTGNYIWANITDATTPSLSDLAGTPFGGGIPEFSTLLIPLLGTIFLFFLMRRKYKK